MQTQMQRKGPGKALFAEVAQMEEFNSSKESSSIFGASYYPQSEVLRVRFKSGKGVGGSYDYLNVPQTVWDGFRKAASKGQYFSSHIREYFKATKVA